ncbi:MAG: sensor histidine kinase [Alphaproteobacteria bacterium]
MKTPFARPWRGLSLAGQFAVAGSLVLLAGMLVIGIWVTRQIEDGVTRNTASATALYMESILAPLSQELASSDTLSPGARRAIDEVLTNTAIGERLAAFKIWKPGGLVVYSSEPSIIGSRFEPTANLLAALDGHVAADFDDLDDEEDAHERALGVPLLEIYSPIREAWTGRVIAVAEFYEIATELKANLFRARLTSWLVVATVTLSMFGLLFGIVQRGSRTIEAQRAAQTRRVDELARLAEQNDALRMRVQRASSRAVEHNERYLRRIGAELHDGPAQLLALASLRLDGAAQAIGGDEAPADLQIVKSVLDDAMRDIRDISRGLSLPALENMTLPAILRSAVEAHSKRTDKDVHLITGTDEPALSQTFKICAYRFVQEGLNNAFRHAGGAGQRVESRLDGGILHLSVSDSGPGFTPGDAPEPSDEGGLGLAGLRERIESLGARLEIHAAPGEGTRLEMIADLNEVGLDE